MLGEDFKNIATRSQRFLVHLILCLCELRVGVEQHAHTQSREVGKLLMGGNFCVCVYVCFQAATDKCFILCP